LCARDAPTRTPRGFADAGRPEIRAQPARTRHARALRAVPPPRPNRAHERAAPTGDPEPHHQPSRLPFPECYLKSAHVQRAGPRILAAITTTAARHDAGDSPFRLRHALRHASRRWGIAGHARPETDRPGPRRSENTPISA